MARFASRIGLGTLGLLTGFGAPRLAAQAWGVTASDPVGIARSGAGVAFGQSLEAASLNPALLSTLKDRASVFVALGQELQITQTTLQSNSTVINSTDRNRTLPSFGAAWRVSDTWALGLKLDEPFMRHVAMPLTATTRYLGQSLDLKTNRVEAQLSWAASPAWSFGASFGVTRIRYAFANVVRVPLPADASKPVAADNASQGLMEVGVQQEASKVVPSYSVGFRWAVTPRWTVAGTYVGSLNATMAMTPSLTSTAPGYFDSTGFGSALPGVSGFGPTLLAHSQAVAGTGKLTLPGKATLGVRQRVNQLFTWEADLRYVQSGSTALPGYPGFSGPSGVVVGSGLSTKFNSGLGASVMGELSLGKRLTARMGLSQANNIRQNEDVDPMVGGARNFTFSGGVGYRVFGGEVNLGYQFRQSQDVETKNLDYVWSQSGVRLTGTTTRVEGMGHLWSIGFKKAF